MESQTFLKCFFSKRLFIVKDKNMHDNITTDPSGRVVLGAVQVPLNCPFDPPLPSVSVNPPIEEELSVVTEE